MTLTREQPDGQLQRGWFAKGAMVLAGALAVGGCDGAVAKAPPVGSGGEGGTSGSAGEGGARSGTHPGLDEEDSAPVFEDDTLRVFDFNLVDKEWDEFLAEAADEAYVPADLSVDGEAVGRVGLRFKGGFGSLTLCFENGVLVCPKLSMKVRFDEYADSQRFYGLKRLNFHSLSRDPSKLHERLAYQLFRQMDVVAPRSVHARVVVNGETKGLFAATEQIDGRFTKNRWPDDGDGNLYKEVWPLTPDPDYYAAGLETNEETAAHDGLVAFYGALESAAPEERTDALAAFADVDDLLAYVAVDRAISNWDGIMAFYCGDWGCSNHNYYWYQSEQADTFTLIPWDLDNTLSVATPFDRVPAWNTADLDCSLRYNPFDDQVETQAPGCDPLIDALRRAGEERYREAVARLLDGPFVLSDMQADVDRWAEQIRPEVEMDPTAAPVEAWEGEVAKLKEDLGFLRLRLEAIYEGKDITPVSLDVGALNDFEAATAVGWSQGVRAYSNAASSVSHTLNALQPLAGAQDGLVSFEFRDEASTPWGQWALLDLPILNAPQDLSATQTLTLTVRAEPAREVRIALVSPAYLHREEGALFGWDIAATPEPQTVTLSFEDLAFPVWWEDTDGELPADILPTITGLYVNPQPVLSREPAGDFGAGITDPGVVQIDDLLFE